MQGVKGRRDGIATFASFILSSKINVSKTYFAAVEFSLFADSLLKRLSCEEICVRIIPGVSALRKAAQSNVLSVCNRTRHVAGCRFPSDRPTCTATAVLYTSIRDTIEVCNSYYNRQCSNKCVCCREVDSVYPSRSNPSGSSDRNTLRSSL